MTSVDGLRVSSLCSEPEITDHVAPEILAVGVAEYVVLRVAAGRNAVVIVGVEGASEGEEFQIYCLELLGASQVRQHTAFFYVAQWLRVT